MYLIIFLIIFSFSQRPLNDVKVVLFCYCAINSYGVDRHIFFEIFKNRTTLTYAQNLSIDSKKKVKHTFARAYAHRLQF